MCGRCWRHRPSLRVAGVALLHCLCWRAWFPLAPRLFVCVRRGVWKRRGGLCGGRHRPPFCVASMAFGDIDLHSVWQAWCIFTGLALVARLVSVGAASVCVAVVVFGSIDVHSVWQAWCLATSTFSSCGRRGTYALGCLWWHAWFPLAPWLFVWQAWRLKASTSILCGRRWSRLKNRAVKRCSSLWPVL